MRKAYTLLELIIVVVIMAISTAATMSKYEDWKFNESFDDYILSHYKKIITVGVLDPYLGYVSSRNEYCSPIGYYEDITAFRVKNCSSLGSIEMVYTGSSDADEKDPAKSYFKGLSTWSDNGEGCKSYLKLGDNNSTEFKVLVNCDDIISHHKEGLEGRIIGITKNSYTSTLKSYDLNATSFSAGGGDDDDGIMLFTFEM